MRRLDAKEVAGRIRACRAYAGLTRQELAEKMETSSSTVERWEKAHPGSLGGNDGARRQSILWEVAKACDLDPAWAIGDWDVPPIYRVQERDVRGIVGRLQRIEQALGLEQVPQLADAPTGPMGPRPGERPEDVVDEIERLTSDPAARKSPASDSRRAGGSRGRGQSR